MMNWLSTDSSSSSSSSNSNSSSSSRSSSSVEALMSHSTHYRSFWGQTQRTHQWLADTPIMYNMYSISASWTGLRRLHFIDQLVNLCSCIGCCFQPTQDVLVSGLHRVLLTECRQYEMSRLRMHGFC